MELITATEAKKLTAANKFNELNKKIKNACENGEDHLKLPYIIDEITKNVLTRNGYFVGTYEFYRDDQNYTFISW